jgi:hypothetical protein
VVGRALESDVEGHLDSVLTGGSEQVVKVVERAELGVDRLVPALFRADCPRAAGLVGPGCHRVVRPFSM